MMNYAIDSNPYLSAAYMIIADDSEREWGTKNWEQESQKNIGMGYTPISMKNEFHKIYQDGVEKAPQQYYPDDETTQSDELSHKESKIIEFKMAA